MKNRNGSYKKILIDAKTLKSHGDYLRTNLKALKELPLSSFEFATLYLLLFLRIKHPKNWLQKKTKSEHSTGPDQLLCLIPPSFNLNAWEKEKLKGLATAELFEFFNLKAVPESINRTMINWFTGVWNIEMLEHIPTPRELLRLQVKNARCMTLITDPEQIDSMVMNNRDPLSFMLHDLMHADQFFSQDESLKGQLGFYKLINDIYDQPALKYCLVQDANFRKEFEYVASDMNAYVIHLFKCLKSAIYRINATESHAEFFNQLLFWWNMNEEQMAASHLLNTPQFNLENELILKNFFEYQKAGIS